MCNTAPLLRIDFQAIKRRKRSDRRRQPDIAEKLEEVKRGNATQTPRGSRMGDVEVANSVGGVPQVGNRLPHAIQVRPTFPMHQILQPLSFVAGVHDAFDLVFLITILCDIGGAGCSHRLTRKMFMIRLHAGDVYDGVNAHGAGKMVFNGVGPDQLRDGIGTEPSFRQLPRGSGKSEIIGGEPDLIPDGICWGV